MNSWSGPDDEEIIDTIYTTSIMSDLFLNEQGSERLMITTS
jgi:hypothetical protein